MLSLAVQSNAGPAGRDDRAKVFQSSDPDEVCDYVGRTLAPHRMNAHNPHDMVAKLRCFDLAPAQIVDIQYGTDVWIDPGELDGHFLVHASIAGSTEIWAGGAEMEMRPDNLYVSSPGTPMRFHMTPECRHLTMRLAQSTLENYLARVMNIPTTRPLIFYPGREGRRDLPVVWRNMLNSAIEQINIAPGLMAANRTRKQFATLMIEILLSNYCNSYSDQIALYGNDISPWHVRRARDIIHGSLDEAISVTDLALEVGVSVRSLQNGFRQFLGLTPVEYVRRHRLEKLHRALMDSGPESNVTELMLECGIVNFGRYAQYYRQQYGCRPSDTLRNRRVI